MGSFFRNDPMKGCNCLQKKELWQSSRATKGLGRAMCRSQISRRGSHIDTSLSQPWRSASLPEGRTLRCETGWGSSPRMICSEFPGLTATISLRHSSHTSSVPEGVAATEVTVKGPSSPLQSTTMRPVNAPSEFTTCTAPEASVIRRLSSRYGAIQRGNSRLPNSYPASRKDVSIGLKRETRFRHFSKTNPDLKPALS